MPIFEMNIIDYTNRRNILFLLLIGSASFMAFGPMRALYNSPINSAYYSHIALIPLVAVYLIFQRRAVIFEEAKFSFLKGISILSIGTVLYAGAKVFENQINQDDFTAIIAVSLVVLVNGAFLLCYGTQAFKAALFPLLFLVFMIPFPSALMETFIYMLQVGSTEFTNLLFTVTGVSFLRDGFVFQFPNMSIEVAKQCSGIRSALALFITAVLAGHLFLNTGWKKVVLALCVFPIAMFKNGVRIVTLTLLGVYVDPRIIQSSLHREGGIPFFVVALLIMAPILFFLRKSEKTVTSDELEVTRIKPENSNESKPENSNE